MTGRSFPALRLLLPLVLAGCAKPPSAGPRPPSATHEHHPPHGGTAVVLGDEAYHVELVRDAATGTLDAYILDGEMENFIRVAMASLTIDAEVGGAAKSITLLPAANAATGETVGDTAFFEGRADWLETAGKFDATLQSMTIRGTTFTGVKFNFPRGND